MKKTLLALLAVACIAVASQLISCASYRPVRTDEPAIHKPYDSSRYRLNEVIVIFKRAPTATDINNLKAKIHGPYLDSATINRLECNSCQGYVELWQAPNIHSRVHADGIRSGGVSPRDSQGVGEDGLAYYSLNFIQNIPMDFVGEKGVNYDSLTITAQTKTGKDVVRIAVLDTGIDTGIIDPSYLWTNPGEPSSEANGVDEDNNCYTDDRFGWNFIGKNNNVMDDNTNLHGTLVSHYIINEFVTSETKAVELMTLKTHDMNGEGDLFSSICAIHYAMEKGAKIINASWGFYYYQDGPHPYLDYLITSVLREKGILFVAAAGNKIDDDDAFADKVYFAAHGVHIPQTYLRDLECHNFYPACLSKKDNNVITVTTANGIMVSPTQNYSNEYVDLGAIPDDPSRMRFVVPFDPGTSISGSSFAAAIVTGRIGAFLPSTSYAPGMDKRDVLQQMENAALSTRSSLLKSRHIRKGRITPHN